MAKPDKEAEEMLDWILKIFNSKELRYLPDDVLANVLANNTEPYDEYIKKYPNLSEDSLKLFFENYLADRKFLDQDFTPDSIAMLLAEMTNPQKEVLDECAGIGSLLIPAWRKNPDVMVYAREKSNTTIPFLLFNLALRNIQGVVVRGDTLTLETFEVYVLNKGEKYSTVTQIDIVEEVKRSDPIFLMKALMAYYPDRFKYGQSINQQDNKQIGFFEQRTETETKKASS